MARPSSSSVAWAVAACLCLLAPLTQQAPASGTSQDKVPVAVVNAVGFHNEVYTALLWTLTQAGADVTAYVTTGEATFQMEDVIRPWYPQPFRSHADFLGEACRYRLVVFATYPEHHLPLLERTAARMCPGQAFALLVHNPASMGQRSDGWELPLFLARASNATLLTLAPHTTARLINILQGDRVQLPVHTFVPVFPVHTSRPGCTALDTAPDSRVSEAEARRKRKRRREVRTADSAERRNCSSHRQGFAVQGLFQMHRRNYHGLLDSIRQRPQLLEGPGVLLRMLGKGHLAIPPELASRVERASSLPYDEYYNLLQEAAAIVPAFASDVYLKDKASSSVAAAIVTGTPLLADAALLGAYAYLPASATFGVGPGEAEADAMARVAALGPTEVNAVAEEMGALRQRLYTENLRVLGPLVEKARGTA